MIRLRSLPLAVVALGLVLVTVLSACSSSSGSAVTVNGTSVSNEDFSSWLKLIAADTGYTSVAMTDSSTGAPVQVHGANSSTYSSLFTSQVLDQQIDFAIAAQEVKRRHLHVTADDVSSVESQLAQQISSAAQSASGSASGASSSADGQAALDKLGSFKPVLLQGYAAQQVVTADIQKKLSTDAALRQTYAKNKSQFNDKTCVSLIAVAAGSGPTQDQSTGALTAPPASDFATALDKANQIEAQLKSGSDFATLAKSSSSDTQSGANGGDIGCVAAGAFAQNQLPELDPVVASVPLNQPSDPIKTVYGYIIVKVRARGDLTFDEAKDQIVQSTATQAQSDYADAITAAAKKADVTVDPQWGSWSKSTAHVIPPLGATSSTTTPTKAPSTSLGLGTGTAGASGASGATGAATTPTDATGAATTPTDATGAATTPTDATGAATTPTDATGAATGAASTPTTSP